MLACALPCALPLAGRVAAQPATPAGAPVGAPATSAGPRGPVRYATAAWSTEHGLPSSIVSSVRQSADGYLWMATFEGLVRFDGVAFRTFGGEDIPGLRRGAFSTLAVPVPAGGGRAPAVLWAGSESGELVRWREGRWRVLGLAHGLPGAPINALATGGDGTLWIGTRRGIWRLPRAAGDVQRVVPLALPAGVRPPQVNVLATGPAGELWAGTVADGLLRLHDGVAVQVTGRDGLATDRIDALHVDPDGTLWVGTYGGSGVGRVRLVDGRPQVVQLGTMDARGDTTGAPRRVRAFHRDAAGTLWLAAENGLFTLDDADPRVATLVPLAEPGAGRGAIDDGRVKVETLAADREGNLWIGTRQAGLFRVRATRVVTLGMDAGLPNAFAFAVTGDGGAGAWVATLGGAVHLVPTASAAGGGRTDARVGNGTVRDALRTPDGTVWLATNTGLLRLPGGDPRRAVTYTGRDGLADDRTRGLAAGRGGALWVATYNGVSEWRAGRLRRYGAADGLADGYVLSVLEDRAGTLWVGTQTAGIFRRPATGPDSGRFVPGPAALAHLPVFRFTEDADGTLWAGTGRGLARIRRTRADGADARLDLITARQGIPGHTVFQALDDGRGALWLTGPWGIGRVARAALHAVADGRAAAVSVAAFGRGDGMVAREASSIGRAWRAADGTLWFATPAGVAVVDPARLPSRPAAPPVLVEQVLADGAALSDGLVADTAAVRLAAGTRTIELRFAAPTFTAPERVRVRWRLEGFDPAWVDGGTRRYATYTNLPPGRYRFVVEARSGDGPWSAPAVRTLTLAPHPWQRPGVLVAAVLLACAAAASAYRWRVRVLWRQAAERATAAAREEVLREASRRDELTGLYNRRGLLALAAERVGDAGALWLLFADLDGLKAINDTLGHAAGDRALRDAADVLRATFRQSDVLARLGGDEFAVLLGAREVAAAEAAEAGGCDVAAHVVLDAARGRLADAVAIHNATAGRPYVLAMSVGASRSTGTEPGDLEALLAEADRRMYEAKRARRQRAGDAPAPPLPVPGA